MKNERRRKVIFFCVVFFVIVLIIVAHVLSENNRFRDKYEKFISDSESKPILSFTFDDGYYMQYYVVYSLMKEYGFNGTLYMIVNLSSFESRELMNFQQAKEMQDNGWEIGSHSLSHKNLRALSGDNLTNELLLSKLILEENGLEIHSLAFPFGYYNETTINEAEKYYSTLRVINNDYNDLKSVNFLELNSKYIKLDNTPEEVCSWINYAKENKKWLILTFHYISNESYRKYDYSAEGLKEILECARKNKIDVKTIEQVREDYEQFRER